MNAFVGPFVAVVPVKPPAVGKSRLVGLPDDQRSALARWLLQTQDRIPSKPATLALTQELLSQMLGIRRTTVTLVAQSLQKSGVIRYSRGNITILDRRGLEEAACECYRIIRHETLPEVIGVDLKASDVGRAS